MRARLLLASFVFFACGELKEAPTSAPAGEDAAGPASPSSSSQEGGAPSVTVETLVSNRSRLGARSSAGFRPWKSGIAVHDGRVYWVESGGAPGIYAASIDAPCASTSCVDKLATLTRPSAFDATSTHLYVADTTIIKRVAFAGGSPEPIAKSTADDVVNLAAGTSSVFWTSGTDSAVHRTAPSSGTTSTPIYSNGTPVGMAVAGDRTFWAGVDISGLLGALQSIKTSGEGAREVSRFSGGFHAMKGDGTYLYYAEDQPAAIHRLTVATSRDEVVDRDALGVTDFAFDDTYAYWTEPGDAPDYANGRVRRVSHDGKDVQTLAVSIARPVAIAVSGKTVLVAAAGSAAESWADGAILRLTVAD